MGQIGDRKQEPGTSRLSLQSLPPFDHVMNVLINLELILTMLLVTCNMETKNFERDMLQTKMHTPQKYVELYNFLPFLDILDYLFIVDFSRLSFSVTALVVLKLTL